MYRTLKILRWSKIREMTFEAARKILDRIENLARQWGKKHSIILSRGSTAIKTELFY